MGYYQMVGVDPLCQFTWYSPGGHLEMNGVLSGIDMGQFGGIQHIPRLCDLSVVIASTRLWISMWHASEF